MGMKYCACGPFHKNYIYTCFKYCLVIITTLSPFRMSTDESIDKSIPETLPTRTGGAMDEPARDLTHSVRDSVQETLQRTALTEQQAEGIAHIMIGDVLLAENKFREAIREYQEAGLDYAALRREAFRRCLDYITPGKGSFGVRKSLYEIKDDVFELYRAIGARDRLAEFADEFVRLDLKNAVKLYEWAGIDPKTARADLIRNVADDLRRKGSGFDFDRYIEMYTLIGATDVLTDIGNEQLERGWIDDTWVAGDGTLKRALKAYRAGSAEIPPETTRKIEALADMQMAKGVDIAVALDAYAFLGIDAATQKDDLLLERAESALKKPYGVETAKKIFAELGYHQETIDERVRSAADTSLEKARSIALRFSSDVSLDESQKETMRREALNIHLSNAESIFEKYLKNQERLHACALVHIDLDDNGGALATYEKAGLSIEQALKQEPKYRQALEKVADQSVIYQPFHHNHSLERALKYYELLGIALKHKRDIFLGVADLALKDDNPRSAQYFMKLADIPPEERREKFVQWADKQLRRHGHLPDIVHMYESVGFDYKRERQKELMEFGDHQAKQAGDGRYSFGYMHAAEAYEIAGAREKILPIAEIFVRQGMVDEARKLYKKFLMLADEK